MEDSTMQFVMPPEWYSHAATWCAFPFNEELWPGILKDVQKEYAQFVLTIAQFEPVHLFVNDDVATNDAAHDYFHNKKNIFIHAVQIDDVWLRDNGPTFCFGNASLFGEAMSPRGAALSPRGLTTGPSLMPIKWNFNAWGEKFPHQKDNLLAYEIFKILNCTHIKANIVFEGGGIEVNGAGVAITTRQCLLNPNRNPHLTQQNIEYNLKKYLGIEKCIWLDEGLEDDHTDGHIDTIVRFVAENKILCSYAEDQNDPNFLIMQKNLNILNAENHDNKFEIILCPLPKNKMFFAGKRLACTYANFYMSSEFVIVPMYSDPNDSFALEIFRKIFPQHKVFGLSSKYIICGGGSFHCLTQQQPHGGLCREVPK